TTSGGAFGVLALDSVGLLVLLPFWVLAPMVQSAFTTLAFRMLATGEPITLQSLWAKLKPRFWTLVANQLLAMLALGGIFTAVFIGYLVLSLGVIFGGASLLAGSPVAGLVLITMLLLIVTVVVLILSAMAVVWFMILPPIVVMEERTDPITAFSRAFELVRPHYKHAVLTCLAFWGAQAVFTLAVMILSIILLGIVIGVASIYADLEQLMSRWLFSLNQAYESVSYIAYMFVMPPLYLMSVLFYFDLRYRTEGLDIYEVLQQQAQG
ncbi:MAG: hypothetical protein NZM28_09870, partial [Fimbriimonadales bacterium]|nr:hypothetical protein [Fimbriimonadales bacterium]